MHFPCCLITTNIQAIGTLCLWGYVHFTYIVEPDDCLKDITERPFPYDEILQVEVYTNSTELWSKRQALLLELSASLTHYRSDKNLTSDTLSEEEIDADLANGWFFWLFSGVPFEEEEEGRQDDGNGTDGVNVRDTEDMEKDVDVSIMEHHSLYEIFDVYSKRCSRSHAQAIHVGACCLPLLRVSCRIGVVYCDPLTSIVHTWLHELLYLPV